MGKHQKTSDGHRRTKRPVPIIGPRSSALACPLPEANATDRVMLAHGEGGRLMRRLIKEQILPAVGNPLFDATTDAAKLPTYPQQLAFTTDSFVVSPLFFPGGDIGSLAVYGTANDLAVAGSVPRWISLSLIVEEGLELSVLEQVLSSVAVAAERVGVEVMTGDTKVVPHGAADKLFINTTGIGEFVTKPPPGPHWLEAGDELIVSGPIGQHGMAVMVERESLALEPAPTSDSAPLTAAMIAMQSAGVRLRAARDATRGGVGAVLHEWAEASGKTLVVEEKLLPVNPEVRGACELLGLDPLHVANEGTMVLAVRAESTKQALDILHRVEETQQARRFGRVAATNELAGVLVERAAGQSIPLDEPLGAPLPRIC